MIQPDSTPASPVTSRARPVMIPWRDVARRLAEGEKPGAVAAGLAIDEDHIWRHLRKSLRFRTYLRQAIERQKYLADLLLEGTGRNAMVALGRQPENLDGGMLRCLLDEAGHTAEMDIPALAKRIERLGETGAPPPNMAFRRRMAEEKRRMDQQVEIWRIQDAARAAVLKAVSAPVPAPVLATATTSAPATPTPGEPQRSQTNANERERSQTNRNERQRTRTKRSDSGSTPADNPPALVAPAQTTGPALHHINRHPRIYSGGPSVRSGARKVGMDPRPGRSLGPEGDGL